MLEVPSSPHQVLNHFLGIHARYKGISMQGRDRRSLQPRGRKHTVENKVNVLSAAERAFQRCARREYRISLEKDVFSLQKKLKQELDIHKALERAFRRTLGVLPRFSPGLPSKIRELLAEVAVLEEEVITLEECIVELRQELYNEAVCLSSSKLPTEPCLYSELPNKDATLCPKPSAQVQHLQHGGKSKRDSLIAKLLPPVSENMDKEHSTKGKPYSEQKPISRVAVHSSIAQQKVRVKNTPPVVPQQSCNNKVEAPKEVGTPRNLTRCHGKGVKDQETGFEKENHLKIVDKLDNTWLLKADGHCMQKSLDMSPRAVSSRFAQVQNTHENEPNLLSEEIVWCLSGIFLRLTRHGSLYDCETFSTASLCSISSAGSFTSRNSFSCNPSSHVTEEIEFNDPYRICVDSTLRDVGPYKYYQEITTSSLDYSKIPRCAVLLKKLINLVEKLRVVNLRGLSHHQKLSFWINIYNACMMHGFLEHGIPDNPTQVVALMGKAVINVGGHFLSALGIEHFILRLPCDSLMVSWKSRDREREGLMHSNYGLEWPEPLVSFALCCGSWSSPALRVYTPEGVEQELEVAKAEFLQAAIGMTAARICIPKLLDWYMRDFAKDVESLMEWISEQLPAALGGSLQKYIANKQGKALADMVKVATYDFQFRYLIAV